MKNITHVLQLYISQSPDIHLIFFVHLFLFCFVGTSYKCFEIAYEWNCVRCNNNSIMVIQHVCSTHHTIGELSELYIISILFIISTTFFWFLLFQINNMCSALAFTITIMAFRSGLSLSLILHLMSLHRQWFMHLLAVNIQTQFDVIYYDFCRLLNVNQRCNSLPSTNVSLLFLLSTRRVHLIQQWFSYWSSLFHLTKLLFCCGCVNCCDDNDDDINIKHT